MSILLLFSENVHLKNPVEKQNLMRQSDTLEGLEALRIWFSEMPFWIMNNLQDQEAQKHLLALQDHQLNLPIIHIILQDPVVEPRNPIQPIPICNLYSRTDAWKDASAASSLLPLPSHHHKPDAIPGITTVGRAVSNLSLRFPKACTSLYLEFTEIFNLPPDKGCYSSPGAYSNWSNCSHFLREFGV